MKRTTSGIWTIVTILLAVLSLSFMSGGHVALADALQQTIPVLDGKIIYYAQSNGESKPL